MDGEVEEGNYRMEKIRHRRGSEGHKEELAEDIEVLLDGLWEHGFLAKRK